MEIKTNTTYRSADGSVHAKVFQLTGNMVRFKLTVGNSTVRGTDTIANFKARFPHEVK